MLPCIDEIEARVLGCLLEKAVTTPDQYPLTLNALTSACNQKSSREPVMALRPGEVQRAARSLRDKTLVEIEENFRSGVEKYSQRFCNTAFGDFKLDAAEYAILCLLLLRGPQTPGEIRARSGRLHEFADNTAVMTAAESLLQDDTGPLLVQLARTPGRKEAEYAHQLCGKVDAEALAAARPAAEAASPARSTPPEDADLKARVEKLESELAALKEKLADLL